MAEAVCGCASFDRDHAELAGSSRLVNASLSILPSSVAHASDDVRIAVAVGFFASTHVDRACLACRYQAYRCVRSVAHRRCRGRSATNRDAKGRKGLVWNKCVLDVQIAVNARVDKRAVGPWAGGHASMLHQPLLSTVPVPCRVRFSYLPDRSEPASVAGRGWPGPICALRGSYAD